MEEIKEVLEEREWLLKEFDYLKQIKGILQERKKKRSALRDERVIISLDKAVRRKVRRLLRKIGRTERRVYTYENRLLRKIEDIGHQKDQKISFEVEGRKVEEKTLEEQVQIYSNRVVLKTSLYQGSISKLLKSREIDWDKIEKEVSQVMKDISSLIALLEDLTFKHEINREKFLVKLKSWGFPVREYPQLAEQLINHWPGVEKLKEAISYNYLSLFRDGLPALDDLIRKNIVPLETLMKEISRMAEEAGIYAENLFQYGLSLAGKIVPEGLASWEAMVKDLPLVCKITRNLLPLETILAKKNLTWPELVDGLQELKGTEGRYLISELLKFMPDLITKETWFKIIKVVNQGRKDSSQLFSFFTQFRSAVVHKLNQEDQQWLFNVLLLYVLSSRLHFHRRIRTSVGLFAEFVERKLSEGKKARQIKAADFLKYMQDLERRKILGELAKNDLVTLKEERGRYIYQVKGITSGGYFLKRATVSGIGVVKGPFPDVALQKFEESDDWREIGKLREKGFLVIHATNAYSGGTAAVPGVEYEPIKNIERDIQSAGKYTISCSSLSPLYGVGVVINKRMGYAIGDVLSQGKIYGAYLSDAGTRTKHPLYRKSDIKRLPVRLAVTISEEYNELLPQKWKMDGVFYTSKTPSRIIRKLEEIAAKHKLKLYAIDEKTRTWKIFAYDRSSKQFVEIKEKVEFREAA